MKWFNHEDLKDVNTLRAAYKRLLIKYHPDNNKNDTTDMMQEINAEYDKLFEQIKYAYESSEAYTNQTDRQNVFCQVLFPEKSVEIPCF
ncbi:DnaJ domain-containing protein, partial [Roseburia inulinivorans]|uniref:DnaJ domain-containing protein n=1 Tax=Roseburia inulinivorans TaxID=360807 RepID=UPI00266C2AC3